MWLAQEGALGHDVKQVPPAYCKPFREGHKNDFRDAHAMAEGLFAAVHTLRSSEDLSLIYKHCTGCDLAWSGNERLLLIRFSRLSLGAWHCGTSGASLPPPTTSGHLG